jgi:lipopolysaccharide export system permease protein
MVSSDFMGRFSLCDRFMVKELLAHFVLGVVVFSLIAFFSDVLLSFLNDLQRVGLDASKAAWLMALQFPKSVALVLPAASFLATLLVFNQLNQTLQLAALRLTGLSLYRLAVPAIALGVLAAGISFWLNDAVIPQCNVTTEAVKQAAVQSGNLPAGNQSFVFRDYDSNTQQLRQLVYVSNYNGQTLGNTTVIDLSKPNVLQLIQARSGQWNPLRWTFNNANLYVIGLTQDLLVFNHLGQFQLNNLITQQNQEDDPSRFRAKFLGFWDLWAAINRREAEGTPVTKGTYIGLWEKLTLPLSCLVIILNAVPLALAPPRSGEQRGFLFALAMMFGFYLVRSLCVALGQAGVFGASASLMLNGVLAAWLPVGVLLVTGVWLLRQKSYVL